MCMDAQVLAGILLEIANEEKALTLDDSATALLMETQNPISQALLPPCLCLVASTGSPNQPCIEIQPPCIVAL